MPDYMRHERARWDYMTDAQLLTRVRRVSIRGKLNCFIQLADRYNRGELLQAGFDRWHTVFTDRHPLERREEEALALRDRRAAYPRPKKPKIIYEPEFRMIR